MSEITTIPSSTGAAHLPAPPRIFAGLRGFKLRPDPVLLGLAGLFGGLGIYNPNQAIATARYVAHELAEIGPWLVASVCIASAARATGLDQLAVKAFKGRESRMIIVASMSGAACRSVPAA